MTRTLSFALSFVAAGLVAAVSVPAQAGDGCFGYGWGMGQLYNSLEYRVPYFAAHPPVYYSYPVPRTYGHSPFAYPPHFRTPEIAAEPVALEISNPYVLPKQDADKPIEAERAVQTLSAPEPLVIHNPYVSQGAELAQAGE